MPGIFISYVRDNIDDVVRLVDALKTHGVEVWLDREEIKPGYRWKNAIREAIAQGDFFLACFSGEYNSRSKTYMNEELTLAIEELRQRPTDRAWFIPVLLSECEVPDRNIGAGETLNSIQWLSLYDDWDEGIRRLVTVIQPVPLRLASLRQALLSEEENVRKASVEALGNTDDVRVVPWIIEILRDENEEVENAAILSLLLIGKPAFTALIKSIYNGFWPESSLAIALISNLDSNHTNSLVDMMIDEIKSLIYKEKNYNEAENPYLFYLSYSIAILGPYGIESLIELVKSETNKDIRQSVDKSLQFLASKNEITGVDKIIEELVNDDEEICRISAAVLISNGDKSITQLIQRLKAHNSSMYDENREIIEPERLIRLRISRILGEIGEASTFYLLDIFMSDSDSWVFAGEALLMIGESAIVEIIKLLGYELEIKMRALTILASGRNLVVPHLINSLGDSDKNIRDMSGAALYGISAENKEYVISLLTDSVNSGEDRVREGATKILHDIQHDV